MRLPRVRFTVRRMMVAVALIAVILALAGRAADLYAHLDQRVASRFIEHTWALVGDPDPTAPPVKTTTCGVDPWPRFWRGFLGRPWPGSYVCDCFGYGTTSIEPEAGADSRRYRLRGTRALTGEEAMWFEVGLSSIKYLRPKSPDP